ncbi:hypothetical protein [Candidatus Spongiihabitans sp.]|uniref:hypothetical protein n=1 Tax=Candidatus Spongiihabitans sp. TaxID=3101308 RepID=UPI003C7D0A4D
MLSGVAELLILNVPLPSQRAFVLSIHHCPTICHCPAHIIIGRAIQLLNRSAKPNSLCGEAAPFDARMTNKSRHCPACSGQSSY